MTDRGQLSRSKKKEVTLSNSTIVPIRPSRSRDARLERKEVLLNGAAEVFARHGLRDTTMEAVADSLNVAKVILYRNFASKDDLIHSILERIVEKLIALDAGPEESFAIRALDTIALARLESAAFQMLARDARNDPIFGDHYQRVHETISTRVKTKLLGISMDPIMAQISAGAITDFCLNGALNWIEIGSPERDHEYGEWVAIGIKTMGDAWRKQF